MLRHSLAVISGTVTVYTTYGQFLASWESLQLCILQEISTIFGTEIQFWQLVYTAFVGNLLYRVSHKTIPCVVLFESFKNVETLIRQRWTLEEPESIKVGMLHKAQFM